jgi:acyl-ACP thioesterase
MIQEGISVEPIYCQTYTLKSTDCDCFGRLKPSALLGFLQEIAGNHCKGTPASWDALAEKNLFFAITRQRVQITRLPMAGETITLETWPGVTTKVAYPRSTVARDAQGNEVFRAISLWVLMDLTNRGMVLPGKSGVDLSGSVRGGELPVPPSIGPAALACAQTRQVRFTHLDRNGHMNNTCYMDWVQDLLPGVFHREHPLADFSISYLSEAMEGQQVTLHHELGSDGQLQVNGVLESGGEEKPRRIFAVRCAYL